MSFTSFLSDRTAVRDRGDWLFEFYLTNPQGTQTILRFSRRGSSTGISAVTIGSDTIAANTPFRRRIQSIPTFNQSLWQSGTILGRSTPSFGSITLINTDGGLDQYRPINGWIWSGCRFKAFFCDGSSPSNLSASIGKIADGYLGTPTFTTQDVSVPLFGRDILFGSSSLDSSGNPILGTTTDLSSLLATTGVAKGPNPGISPSSLSVPTSKRVFRGTSFALELSGVRQVSYGSAAALNITGSMTLEGWMWIDTAPNADTLIKGWNPGFVPWAIVLKSTMVLRFAYHVGGVAQGLNSTTTLSVKKWYHTAITISGRDLTYCIWDDDAQTTTTETNVNGLTNATRDTNVGGNVLDASANVCVIWFDEWRLSNVARTQAQIEADRFRPIPSGSVPTSMVHCVGYDDGTGTSVTDISATAANGTISGAGTSTWLHAQEGGPELAGTPKPDVWGEHWGTAPVLVDQARQGYMVAGGLGGIQDLTSYAGGSAHTMDATAASYRAYLTTTPAAGHSLRYLTRGLFKLGSSPTKPVSVYVKGYNGGALGYVNKGDAVLRDIVTRRGPKLTDPTDLDTSSLTSYATANPGIIGMPLYQPIEMASALDQILLSGAGWWGFKRGLTLLHLEQFAGPSVTADYNFDQRRIVDISPLPPSAVIYGVVVRYRHNDVVHNNTDIDGTVLATTSWQQWTMEWQSVQVTDEVIRAAYPGNASIMVTIDTLLQYQNDAQNLAIYLLPILKGQKDGWKLTLDSTGYQITPGQTCTLSLTLQAKSSKRLNLDGTKKYIVLSVGDNMQNGTTELEVFG